jgi:hypothetical protein
MLIVLDQLYESTILDLPEDQLSFPFLIDAARHLRLLGSKTVPLAPIT